eukprot:GHVR01180155.1.p1 GENE.GHVR01180155.1~~GHVR01180155.1.p1  ORF type:complete len:301 (-),score=64.80 GHVR01180155.1:160-1062(-)
MASKAPVHVTSACRRVLENFRLGDEVCERYKDAQGRDVTQTYILERVAGQGAFGVVFRARSKEMDGVDGKPLLCALKILDLEEDAGGNITKYSALEVCKREVDTQKGLSHPNVVKLFRAFVQGKYLVIVMELADQGSVRQYLRHWGVLSPQVAAFVCREALKGLTYMHSKNMIHRDIKAANFLLNEKCKLKLADFGVSSKEEQAMKAMSLVGTPYWMAPEVIQSGTHGCSADIWSLGITAYEIATGDPPYAHVHPTKVLFTIASPSAPSPELPPELQLPKEFEQFLAACLVKDPEKSGLT